MASNTGAPYPAPAAAPGYHPCPECGKVWGSARACSGHMAVHSRDANRSRRNAPMSDRDNDMLRMLVPNPTFWNEYRSGGRRPATIMFPELLLARVHWPELESGNNVPRRSRNAAPAPVANGAEDDGSSMGSFLSLKVNSNI